MRDDDLDPILSREERVLPSSGFAASVMRLVREEAATPPAISFPWKRALPLVGGAILVVACVLIGALGLLVQGAPPASAPDVISPAIASAVAIARSMQLGWIAAALVLSLASVKLSLRLADWRA